MATVYSPNVIEIAVDHTLLGRPCVNVWHMWFDAELGTDTIADVVGDFRDNWQDHMLDLSASDLVLNGFRWRSLDPGNTTLGTVDPDPAKSLVGTADSTSLPRNCAMLVKKNTEDRPRGARDGRSFIGGVPASVVFEDGTYNATFAASIGTALTSFYNGISDTSGTGSGDRYPCVLETTPASRAPGSQSVTVASRRVTSITLDPLISTQRDRLR